MHRKLIVGIAATLKSAGTAIFAINAKSWDLNPAFYRVLKLNLLEFFPTYQFLRQNHHVV